MSFPTLVTIENFLRIPLIAAKSPRAYRNCVTIIALAAIMTGLSIWQAYKTAGYDYREIDYGSLILTIVVRVIASVVLIFICFACLNIM